MSFFGNSNQWSGFLKQAISNVETTFDTLLEQAETPGTPTSAQGQSSQNDTDTETYLDPISGMVTTIPKKKPSQRAGGSPAPATSTSTTRRSQTDLNARLAAVMADRAARSSTSSLHSATSDHTNDMPASPTTAKEKEPPRTSTDLNDLNPKVDTTPDAADEPEKTQDASQQQQPSDDLGDQTLVPADLSPSKDDKKSLEQPTAAVEMHESDKNDETDKIDKSDKGDKGDKTDKIDKGDEIDKNDISDNGDELDKIDKTDNPEADKQEAYAEIKDVNDVNDVKDIKDEKSQDSSDDEKKGAIVTQTALQDTQADVEQDASLALAFDSTTEEDAQDKADDMSQENNKIVTEIIDAPLIDVDDDMPPTPSEPTLDAKNEETTEKESDTPSATPQQDNESEKTTNTPLDNHSGPLDASRKTDDHETTAQNEEAASPTPEMPPQPMKQQQATPADAKTAATAVRRVSTDDHERVLAQREQQLLQAMETIAKLHDQIHTLQQDEEQYAIEVETLKKQLEEQQSSQASSWQVRKNEQTINDLTRQIATKDEQIQGLMEEGEKLSKNELKQTTVIKKLRAEKQEHDKALADVQARLDKATGSLNEAKSKTKQLTESERRAQDSIKMLQEMTERQTKHISKLETENAQLKAQYQEIQATLTATRDNLDKERLKAKAESEEVHAAALEKEVAANNRLHNELTHAKKQAEATEAKLRNKVRDLHVALQTLEIQAAQREDHLQQEVSQLQTQLQNRDAQIDELTTNSDSAAAPLLRQLEELQTQHSMVTKERDLSEQRMLTRLQELEKTASTLREKATHSDKEAAQHKNRVRQLESEAEEAAAVKAKLTTEIASLQHELTQQQEATKVLQARLDEWQANEGQATEAIKKQYQKLMRERLQEEKKKLMDEHQAIVAPTPLSIADTALLVTNTIDKNAHISPLIMPADKSPQQHPIGGTNGQHSSTNSSPTTHSTTAMPYNGSSVSPGPAGIHATGSSRVMIERLQASLRQMENQLNFYQTQLQSTTQSRDELADEVTKMTIDMDKLRNEYKQLKATLKDTTDLEHRHQAALELLGERTEQVEELKADIADVKDLYRTQVVELVQKIDQLTKANAAANATS